MKRYVPWVVTLLYSSALLANIQPFLGQTLSRATMRKIAANGTFEKVYEVQVSLIRQLGSEEPTGITVQFDGGRVVNAVIQAPAKTVKVGKCGGVAYTAVYQSGPATAATSAASYEYVTVTLTEVLSGKCSAASSWTAEISRRTGGYAPADTLSAEGTPEIVATSLSLDGE